MDERVVAASIVDHQQHTLCRVINTYVPAQASARRDFLCSFLDLPFVHEVDTDPWLLMGDFNMNLHSHSVTQHYSVRPWIDWITMHFDNCLPEGLSTFKQRNTRTTIDYIFGHHSLRSRLTNASIHYPPYSWTDHSLMTVDLLPARQDLGRGSWRFNPTLLSDEGFTKFLDHTIDMFFDTLEDASHPHSALPPQDQWEALKHLIQHTAKRHTQGATKRYKRRLSALQQQRQELLSNNRDVTHVEQEIESLTNKDTRHAMLRSATRWHEKGERNNAYFYRVIKSRQQQQTIQSLKCPRSNSVVSSPQDIIRTARDFYQHLYAPEDIDLSVMDRLLANVPSDVKLSTREASNMIARLHKVDLLDLVAHTPSGRSPGLDGLPFELYKHLAPRSNPFCSLLLQVIRDAFEGKFPTSWSDTRMVLLYKKGDPELLGNWRPLSLINSDAKLFTKLIANRVNEILPSLINPYQTGFLPHRLISDNGWLNQVLMHNARSQQSPHSAVAVFLDQEKAYGRVHPEYLQRVLLHFGFPSQLVSSLCTLFFVTQIFN